MHTVLLRSDGAAVAFGFGNDWIGDTLRTLGEFAIPALVEGVTYTQVAAGVPIDVYDRRQQWAHSERHTHTVLLKSDGTAVAVGRNHCGQCDIPTLAEGLTYIQVAAGECHTVLLRSDGIAVTCGGLNMHPRDREMLNIPPLPEGVEYIQVAAGGVNTVLLRSDGMAVGCGVGSEDIPALAEGLTYIRIAAGGKHTVLLRSDGMAVTCGLGARIALGSGPWSRAHINAPVPALEEGLTYTEVAAGTEHTVLLRSDGMAVAFGTSEHLRQNIPGLAEGVTYVGVAAGAAHTVLITSQGHAVAFGRNKHGQCNVPSLYSWQELLTFREPCLRYIPSSPKSLIVQASFTYHLEGTLMQFSKLSGEDQCSFSVFATDRISDIQQRIRLELGHVEVVLPSAQLLSQVLAQDPLATLEPFLNI